MKSNEGNGRSKSKPRHIQTVPIVQQNKEQQEEGDPNQNQMQWPLISSSIYFDPDFFFVQTFKHKQILLCVPWVNRVPCPVFFCVILSSLEEYFVVGLRNLGLHWKGLQNNIFARDKNKKSAIKT